MLLWRVVAWVVHRIEVLGQLQLSESFIVSEVVGVPHVRAFVRRKRDAQLSADNGREFVHGVGRLDSERGDVPNDNVGLFLRRERNGSRPRKRLREASEHHEVGVKDDTLQATSAKRSESVVMLRSSELALDGSRDCPLDMAVAVMLEPLCPGRSGRPAKQRLVENLANLTLLAGSQGLSPGHGPSRCSTASSSSDAPCARSRALRRRHAHRLGDGPC